MLGPSADLLSLLYAAVALYTLWQLPGRWRALTDATYTDDDRNLANRIGFLLLTPLGVLAHEAAHLVAAQALGAERTSLSYRVYWGYVQYAPRLGLPGEWIVAAAGPAASLALGLLALAVGLRLRTAWRDVALAFAHATLLLVLIFYPAMSAVDGVGDFVTIYGRAPSGLAVAAGTVHAAGLLAYLLAIRRLGRERRAEARAARSEQFAGRMVALRPEALARLAALEQDARFRRLTPEERQELEMLGELRAWSAAHNRVRTLERDPAVANQDSMAEAADATDMVRMPDAAGTVPRAEERSVGPTGQESERGGPNGARPASPSQPDRAGRAGEA